MLAENPMSQDARGGIAANSRGFSLVELLVVVVIFGVISTVVLDLYVNVVRSTTSSEEVVEVQQGMRLALEQVARDVQMAGFMVPTGIPITVARNDQLTLTTASAFRTFARIENPATFNAASTAIVNVDVGSAAMARLFRDDNYVRIVSPATGVQVGAFKVISINSTAVPPYLRLEPLEAPAAAIIVANADMIVRVPSPGEDATYPNAVTYLLEADPISTTANMMVLSRIWRAGLPALTAANRDTGDRVLATKITGLRFEYLMNDGTVEPAPAAAAGTAVAVSRLDNIVGVRIFLTGLAEEGKTRGIKTRELQTTVKIRNI
jgi:prepilin-type N-terminal cleavage/methylation domain-containing protein